METVDDFMLNPIIEFPMGLGVVICVLMAAACLWRVRAGVFLLLATVPLQRFIVIPGILGSRFTPHEAAFICFLGAAIVRQGRGIRLTRPWTSPIAAPLLLLLSVSVLSLLGNPFAQFGIAEIVILAYLYLLLHLVLDIAADERLATYAFQCWYVIAGIFSALSAAGGLLHLAGIPTFLMSGPRLVVTFFNPNQAGSFILATVFLFLVRMTQSNVSRFKKLVNLGLLFCSVVGGYFMASRAALLGAAAGLVMFLILRRVRVAAIAPIAAMLIGGWFALSAFQKSNEADAKIYDNRYSEGVDVGSQSAQVRFENWQTGVDAFARSPIVGIGIGTLWLQTTSLSGESYQVHNTYLSFLGETGFLGFACLMAIIGVVIREAFVGFRMARGSPYESALAGLIPAFTALGVFNIFHYGIRARHLWVTMALIMAYRRLATRWHARMVTAPRTAAPQVGSVVPVSPRHA